MNQSLQNILNLVEQSETLSAEQKKAIIDSIKETDKAIAITEFKLDRTEKVKRTTAILLEETIAELELKRKAVEEKNHELEIESALERVRSVAMGMKKREDMLDICKTISQQLELLKVKEIRNVQTAIFYDERGVYTNYEYYAKHDKLLVTDTEFRNHPVAEKFANQMMKGANEIFIHGFTGKEVKDWLEYQKGTNVFIDSYLETASSLTYYWYSLGPVAMGISTYVPLKEEEIELFKRFRNVFELAYRRYLDIEKAEAQARESQIQLALERVRARTMAMQKSDELSEAVFVLFQQFKELGENPDQATIGVINEKEHVIEYWVTMYGNQMNKVFKFSIDEPHVTNRIYNAWKEGKKSLVIDLSGKDLLEFMAYRAGKGGAAVNPNEKRRIINVAFFSKGLLNVQSNEERSEESIKLLERFAAVFEQTYTRFLDLQKAEEQAREAKIEAALERTRTQSMIMQHSKELDDTLRVFHEQLLLLGIPSAFSFLWLPDEDKDRHIFWAAWAENNSTDFKSKAINYPLDRNEPATAQCLVDWKSNEPVVSYHVPPAGVESYFAAWQELIAGVEQLKPEYFYEGLYYVEAFMKYGCFGVMVKNDLPEDEKKILGRFAIEFERTYTRFLDLQKAEAQAKEAQIELALERVRARTMAMQKSEELKEVIQLVYEQFIHLNIHIEHTGFLMDYKARDDMHIWLADQHLVPSEVTIPWFDSPPNNSIKEAKEKGQDFFKYLLTFEEKNKFYRDLFKFVPGVPEETLQYYFNCPGLAGSGVLLDNIGLYIENFSGTPYTDEENNILMRFGKVFQQTYTRFLDLQKAEAQSREGQIQLALERVRARTMAMQKSDELQDVVHTLLERLKDLNVEFYTSIIILFAGDSKDIVWWLENKEKQQYSRILVPYTDIAYLRDLFDVRENGSNHFSKTYSFEEKNELFHHLFSATDFQYVPEKQRKFLLESKAATMSVAIAKNTGIHLTRYTDKAFSEEDNAILKRFVKVFEQTYTRFLDLQKAEAQSREAQIEIGLERVRSRAMAMQSSEELNELIGTLFAELTRLDLKLTRCSIWIFDTKTNDARLWMANSEDPLHPVNYFIPFHKNLVFLAFLNEWKKRTLKWEYKFEGQIKKDWDDYLFSETELSKLPEFVKAGMRTPDKILFSASFNNFGGIHVASLEALADEHFNVLLRFAKVFDVTYTRFLDLQKAEAQAREAQIEAALEKVRSRTLAMQKSDELAETAAVLFKQLVHLSIEPNRLYIGIIKDDNGHIEFWATDEEGDKVSTQFIGDASRNASMKKMYDAWKAERKSLTIDMQGKELSDYFQYMADELKVPFTKGLLQKRRIQNIAIFGKGFLGIASPDEQPESTTHLLERFAAVFNLTYTRFNDLQIAEAHALKAEQDIIEIKAARKKAEETLSELQATQKQLIQSEKMASLGELTAGIAHEIQNPLNFVNNFSDVSNELLDEMKTELDKGEIEEAKVIADDVKQNLEKILHHGKRADAIVKGMLQHSRSSSGVKEPTDINALADEYLRLAYHGLRAKDKTFNSAMKTDYDESIGLVKVIPQDMGRVILNLITNAFYAVSEKKKHNIEGYEPVVMVNTKKINDRVEVHVKDNGTGIPQKALDKIFQPFFTTKPTGQGTGLGLSLSYDIITKGHGGELKVETKEGEGSEFTIVL